jgi:hypothetical protein
MFPSAQRLIRILLPIGLAAVVTGAFPSVSAIASQTRLHVVPSPFVNNATLTAAAALAAGDMWAVGDIPSASGETQTLAEHFNGTSWSIVPTPTMNATFSGVAGAASTDVWAIGNRAVGTSFNTLIEHWNGTSWSVVSSPKLPDGSALTGVTAPATNNVWAVGFASGSSALVEHWDGASWGIVSSSAFTNVVNITGVSADSSTDVWAVGALAAGGTASLHWDGQTWTERATALLRFGGVVAVTALSSTNVWAVGTGPGVASPCCSAHPTAVIEHWDGMSWRVVPSPNPNPQGNNSLAAVSAVSASDIWAVGRQILGPFTERWDGKNWSIVATPGEAATLVGLTTLSAGTVVIVGHGTDNSAIILSN